MSRADREKSLYIIRLNQIREELRQSFPQEFEKIQIDSKSKEESQKEPLNIHNSPLDQISEKINEEYLSDENDYSDEGDEYNLIPEKQEPFDRTEYLKQVNENRAK